MSCASALHKKHPIELPRCRDHLRIQHRVQSARVKPLVHLRKRILGVANCSRRASPKEDRPLKPSIFFA
eukprot:5986145-Prorocentrum_lima.AAC.1